MLPIDSPKALARRRMVPIEALDLGEATIKTLRRRGFRTVSALKARWQEFADGRVRHFGPARVAALWAAVCRHESGVLPEGNGPLPQDPTPEEIKQRCSALQRGWHQRRLSPEPAPVEMYELADPRRTPA